MKKYFGLNFLLFLLFLLFKLEGSYNEDFINKNSIAIVKLYCFNDEKNLIFKEKEKIIDVNQLPKDFRKQIIGMKNKETKSIYLNDEKQKPVTVKIKIKKILKEDSNLFRDLIAGNDNSCLRK